MHNQNSSLIKSYLKNRHEHVEITSIMMISGMAIAVYIILNSLREIVQLYQQKWHYLLEPINFISWLLYISAGMMISPMFGDGDIDDLNYSAASVTVFLSWFNLLLLLQRFDQVH